MSDSQAYEELSISSEGVTVLKRFEEDEFPVPAIAFEFQSERDESVTIRMSDTVPADIEVEDLGFHPEYGSEYWTIDEDTIIFERDLEANAEYTTVYGIRATGSDDVEQFLTEPTLEEVDPPLPDDDVVPESGDDAIKDAIAGDGEIPGLENDNGDDDDSGADDEDLETLDLKDPNEPGDDGTTTTDGEEAPSRDGSVVAAMANEIRRENVSADDVKILQRALDAVDDSADSGSDGATAARLDQLQSDIADLRAYTGALEEFLEDNGTGADLIDDFEEQLDEFDDTLSSIRADIADNSDDIESLSDDVSDVSEEVDDVSEEMDDVSNEMEAVTEEVDSVFAEVTEVGEEVETFSDDIESLQASVDDLEDTVEDLESRVTDDDVGEQLTSIEEDIEDLQTWQEQIKETFGGG